MACCYVNLLCFLSTILGLVPTSYAIICGDTICSGSSSCCGDSCCNDMWDLWWFWSIWVFIFLMMVACGFCWRRQRAARLQRRQVLIVQRAVNPNPPYVIQGYGTGGNSAQQQGYGTVGNSECAPILYAPSPAVQGPNQPVYGYASTHVPPAYTPATKPPEYTATA